MTTFNEKNGVPLGEGVLSPDGSVQDKDLSGNLRSYKARVAGSYRAALPEEITSIRKDASGKYVFDEIDVYEGTFLSSRFGVSSPQTTQQRFILDNPK